MLDVTSRGDGKSTEDHLRKLQRQGFYSDLDQWGRMGVDALEQHTPIDEGESQRSWGYRIVKKRALVSIEWFNTHLDDDGRVPVVILLQYGHATGTGGYVQGIDFINPAMKPVFDKIADEVWKKVMT